MALTQIFDGKTDTGASSAYNVGELKGTRNSAGTHLTVHLSGITTGTVQFQIGPTSTGPWEVPTDGELTADGVVVTPIGDDWWIRLNVSVATAIDLDAWAG